MNEDVQRLLCASRAELASFVRSGHAIDPTALDDMEYRGLSLGLPAVIERITWKKFKKVFHRDVETGGLRGWNVRIEQGPLDEDHVPQMRNGRERTFGHFDVVDARSSVLPRAMQRGLALDYRPCANGRFNPMRLMIDPLVAIHKGSAEILLGLSYLCAGNFGAATPTFFCLERDRPLTHHVAR